MYFAEIWKRQKSVSMTLRNNWRIIIGEKRINFVLKK